MSVAPLHFRTAANADLDTLLALVQSAYRGESSRAGWTTEADLLDGQRTDLADLRACLTRERSRLLVAEQADAITPAATTIMACAHIAIDADEDGGDAGHFGMFAVRPQAQGSGVGKALLAEAERIVGADWQLPAMRMSVIDVRTELIAFYERRGYHRTGIYRPFPYGDERFGIPRRDDLRFEILEKPLGAAPDVAEPRHSAGPAA